jgi:heavy metal sensor kinase
MRFGRLEPLIKSLRFRVTFWNTVGISALLLVTFVGLREGLRSSLQREMDRLLREDLDEIRLVVRKFDRDIGMIREEVDRKAVSHKARAWFVRIFDEGDATLIASTGAPDLEEVPPRLHGEPFSADGFRVCEGNLERKGKALRIRVGCSLAFVSDDVDALTRILLLASLGIVVLAPLTGYWLAGRATRPLALIARTAARARPGHLHERVPCGGSGDELDQLAGTFNGLLDRLAAHLDRQRSFVANAAHELRSPLAALRASAEVALGQDRSPEEYRERLADIVEECDSLGVLVNQLLLLAEGEAGFVRTPRRFSLDQIAARVVAMFEGVGEMRGISLVADILDPVYLWGSDVHLRQVLSNLVDNALKFTPPGGSVRVRVWLAGDRACVEVRDTGAGMTAEELAHVFERFYRADPARTRDPGGSGLGLSICQALVLAHDGTIAVESRLGEGTCVRVSFPAAASQPPA